MFAGFVISYRLRSIPVFGVFALLFFARTVLEGAQSFLLVEVIVYLRHHLYGLVIRVSPKQPSPRVTLTQVTLSLFLFKIQRTVYIRIANPSRGTRQLGWASCLASAGRVILVSGTIFPFK